MPHPKKPDRPQPDKRGRGAPSLYNHHQHPILAKALAMRGYTTRGIARALKVGKTSIYKWAKEHPDFADALAYGRAFADAQVELALFKRATGYDIEEQEVTLDSQSVDCRVKSVKRTKKHVPSDVAAAKFWLVNRKPRHWRDKQEIDLDAKVRTHAADADTTRKLLEDPAAREHAMALAERMAIQSGDAGQSNN